MIKEKIMLLITLHLHLPGWSVLTDVVQSTVFMWRHVLCLKKENASFNFFIFSGCHCQFGKAKIILYIYFCHLLLFCVERNTTLICWECMRWCQKHFLSCPIKNQERMHFVWMSPLLSFVSKKVSKSRFFWRTFCNWIFLEATSYSIWSK